MSDYVSEAGHFYTREGEPAYTQEVKTGVRKGKERPTTLRDARKLNLVPSVTTISSILDKPALTHWKIKRAVEKALANERGLDFVEDNSAGEGSLIHGAIDNWLETGDVEAEYEAYTAIAQKVFDEVGVTNPVAERSFCSPLGYGGAVDLSCPASNIILDWKTKVLSAEDVERGKKLAYPEHAQQLAAYREGLGMPDAKCYNVFLSRTNPEVYVLHEWGEEELQKGWRTFSLCHALWIEEKGYDPKEGVCST